MRFRIYDAELRNGSIRELTMLDGITITWHVEVANLKAGWYQYNQAIDLPYGLSNEAQRRNDAEASRGELDVIPTMRTVSGASQRGPHLAFDDGGFYDREVYPGELRTDNVGCLIFLGGFGVSSPRVTSTAPTTFANNDGWRDDICDGPARATVTIDHTRFEATPAHVVVAPPNYAPGLFGAVTMDNVAREVFLPRPTTTRFAHDAESGAREVYATAMRTPGGPFWERMSGSTSGSACSLTSFQDAS